VCGKDAQGKSAVVAGKLADTGGWGYVADEKSPCYGTVFVDCTTRTRKARTGFLLMRQPYLVFKTGNVMEAREVAALLEGSGLPASVSNEHLVALDPMLGPTVGEVQVFSEADAAEKVLELFRSTHAFEGQLPMYGNPFFVAPEDPQASLAQEAEAFHCVLCGVPIAELKSLGESCPNCGVKGEVFPSKASSG